jgi:hypothetical protein
MSNSLLAFLATPVGMGVVAGVGTALVLEGLKPLMLYNADGTVKDAKLHPWLVSALVGLAAGFAYGRYQAGSEYMSMGDPLNI